MDRAHSAGNEGKAERASLFGLFNRLMRLYVPVWPEYVEEEKHKRFFAETTKSGKRNNELMGKLYDIYGEEYVIKQFSELTQDRRFNGGGANTEVNAQKQVFPGMGYSFPLMPYLAEIVLTENKARAYQHYVANVAAWSEEKEDDLEAVPNRDTLETIAAKYVRRFVEKKRRMERAAAAASLPDAKVPEHEIQ